MTQAEIAAITAIIELILKYGLPAAIKMIQELETDNPTAEQIYALVTRVPHPDTYEKGD